MSTAATPFRVVAGDDRIEDLRERLARTRWPDALEAAGWDYGTDPDYLRELCEYWRTRYDWRGFETRHNAYTQYLTEIDGQPLHYYHVRSPEPQARALILSHGWPGSVTEFLDVIGPLSNPRAHGGEPGDAFHVVVPSLPGFGFSGPTRRRGYRLQDIADAFHRLMRGLGYTRYFAQGGDWGAPITMLLGAGHPDSVGAIHLNLISGAAPPDPQNPQAGLNPEEIRELQANAAFAEREAGYQQIQRTKPQTLAYGLSDSPAGLAAWITEKFRTWTDCGGDIERAVPRERLLDNLSIYWLTGTIGSSMRLYFEETGPGRARPFPKVTVPTGHARFPAEIYKFPRAWAETRYSNITRWQTMPRGGHFPAMEVPELFVGEVREFFRAYR
jgi:epoxide hydrolase